MNQQDPYQSPGQTPNLPGQENHPSGVPAAERQWGMFSHLSSLSGFIVPLGNVLGPLVMYLIKKDEYRFGSEQAKEALNFNIACCIYFIVSFVLVFVVIGIFLMIALGIFWLIVTIIATTKANDGIAYRYPMSIRFIS